MKYINISVVLFALLITSGSAFADNSKLYGNWKSISHPIKIHLMKNMRFVYSYKMLSFSGTWKTSNNNEITLNYSVFGSKRSKTATYSVNRGFLTLRSNEHENVTLKKR